MSIQYIKKEQIKSIVISKGRNIYYRYREAIPEKPKGPFGLFGTYPSRSAGWAYWEEGARYTDEEMEKMYYKDTDEDGEIIWRERARLQINVHKTYHTSSHRNVEEAEDKLKELLGDTIDEYLIIRD